MGLQTMNAPPIGAITIWSGAYNSSFLVNFLQANNMPKPNLQDGHKTNASFVLQKGPHHHYLFTVRLVLFENFHMVRKKFWRRRKLEGMWTMRFLPSLQLFWPCLSLQISDSTSWSKLIGEKVKCVKILTWHLVKLRGGVLPGYTIYLCNLGKLAKRGGGGYPQALPKVFILWGY